MSQDTVYQPQENNFHYDLADQLTQMFLRAQKDKRFSQNLLKVKKNLEYDVAPDVRETLGTLIEDALFINEICKNHHFEFAKFIYLHGNMDCEISKYKNQSDGRL